MTKIAYILLCHKNSADIVAQARRLTAAGDCVAIHFDARAPRAAYQDIRDALADNIDVAFAARRQRCGWGEWSLVQATLDTLETAMDAFPDATHFYLISGDCMAIKTAEYIHQILDARPCDLIETVDFFRGDWIRTGLREDRLTYRHWFNERRHPRAFYASHRVQKRLGLRRRLPGDLQVRIGSQWWCLRRATVEKVLDFTRTRRDAIRFFRTTWIPDETFFQTVVRHTVPRTEIAARSPTLAIFSDYGKPVTFYNDHHDLLLGQDFLFARKISPKAAELRQRLGRLYAATGIEFRTSDEAPRLYGFLTGRGRVGRRFAPRFWETESTLGRQRELLIVACKKWHVAKRLLDRIRQITNLPTAGYLFDEAETPLPDMGGLETTMEKRTRHRRAFMRVLFDVHATDRLLICLDPSRLELMRDFTADRAQTRILEVACSFTDGYLAGHAARVGLAGPQTGTQAMARLLPTIRGDIADESDRIRDARFPHHYRLNDTATAAVNAPPLAAFLSVDQSIACRVLEAEGLFSD